MRRRCDVRSVCIQHCMVSPTIVLIFYHNIPVTVNKGLLNNIKIAFSQMAKCYLGLPSADL